MYISIRTQVWGGGGGGFNSFICKLVIGSRRRRRRSTDIIYIHIYKGTGSGGVGSRRVFAGRREGERDRQTMTECQRLKIRGVLPLLHVELYCFKWCCVCVRVISRCIHIYAPEGIRTSREGGI
uniref:Uncharacterized protein n=1 Tax=Schizaphis graminum TaxID=13262 RepID=A0A2S2N8W2_SCHGA